MPAARARVLAVTGAMLVTVLPATFAAQQEAGGSAPAGAANGVYAAAATLTGPITTGHVIEPLSPQPVDLAANGYVEQEYFASGTAATFKATSMPTDGRWSITPTTTASYKTRILVRRPEDPARFNGVVVVEWLNVSAGESAPDWEYLSPTLMRDGYAYVGVSAQALGVSGGTSLLGEAAGSGLVGAEPARYGTLHHPGDQGSFDIFAAAAAAVGTGRSGAVDPLGGLDVRRVIATGASQSAMRLATYLNAVHRSAPLIVIDSR